MTRRGSALKLGAPTTSASHWPLSAALIMPRMHISLLMAALLLGAVGAPSIIAAASKFVPGVTWRSQSVLTADFTCRGRREQAILGVTPKEIVIAVFLNGTAAPPEILRYSAAVRDANTVKLTVESLDYDAKDAYVRDLPGLRRSHACKGLNLSDDMIDSVHIYWNHDARRFSDWTR